jgi:hypothetical protein
MDATQTTPILQIAYFRYLDRNFKGLSCQFLQKLGFCPAKITLFSRAVLSGSVYPDFGVRHIAQTSFPSRFCGFVQPSRDIEGLESET